MHFSLMAPSLVICVLGKSPDVPKKRQAPKKVTGKAKKQTHIPTDIEIEAPPQATIKEEPQASKPTKQTIKPVPTKSPKKASPKASPKVVKQGKVR